VVWCSAEKIFLVYEAVIIISIDSLISINDFVCIAKYSLNYFPIVLIIFELEPFFEKGFFAHNVFMEHFLQNSGKVSSSEL
jgi:hypothetical protein